jgi:hypothetical protein
MMEVSAIIKDHIYYCHPLYKSFLRSLYKEITPATMIAPHLVWNDLRIIIQKRTISPDNIARLQMFAPLLCQLSNMANELRLHEEVFNTYIQILEGIMYTVRKTFTPEPTNARTRYVLGY